MRPLHRGRPILNGAIRLVDEVTLRSVVSIG
jgi:hypothetical protein